MKTLKTAAMLGLLAITVPAFSQIIIDWDEIPQTDEFWTKNIKDTAYLYMQLATSFFKRSWPGRSRRWRYGCYHV